MDKQEQAQRFAEILLKTTHANHGHLGILELENISETAYSLADYMQAEADKRNYPEKQDSSEWQPDWSQAPALTTGWSVHSNGSAKWHISHGSMTIPAPLFDYKGDWENSLRKRPQGE